jgi:hypothetical protein
MVQSKPTSYSWGHDGNLERRRASCFNSCSGRTKTVCFVDITGNFFYILQNTSKIIGCIKLAK